MRVDAFGGAEGTQKADGPRLADGAAGRHAGFESSTPTLEVVVMQPTDQWHTEQADWRIQVVSRLELNYPGCSDHTVGAAVLSK